MQSDFAVIIPKRGHINDAMRPLLASRLESLGLLDTLERGNICLFLPQGVSSNAIIDPLRGAIVGTVFDRNFHPVRDDAALLALADDPQHFMSRYWGSYLAIDWSACAQARLMRDPGGMFGCYYVETEDWLVAAADLQILRAIGPCDIAIDWTAMADFLRAPDYRMAQTIIAGVRELPPGACLTVTEGRSIVKTLWSPWEFASRAAQYQFREEAISEVRRTCDGVTAAWASCASHVLVELSGGLDSSIVAGALSANNKSYSCVTYATQDKMGDERAAAARLTQHLGVHHHSAFLDLADVNLMHCEARHLPNPVARSFEQAVDAISAAAADAEQADMFMHGGGGDNVFCYIQSTSPALDQLCAEGMSKSILTTLNNICDITGCSIWQATGQFMRRLLFEPPVYRWNEDHRFLKSGLFHRQLEIHPWFGTAKRAMPGKIAHLAMLLRIRNSVEAFGRSKRAPVIAPLLAQPLVEVCLRIPSWWWCEGGYNRAIARDAYRDILPPATVARRLKGSPDSFVARLFDTRRKDIGDILYHGRLAAQGLLDIPALTAALEKPGPIIGDDFVRILTLVDVEAWAKGQGRPVSALPLPPPIHV